MGELILFPYTNSAAMCQRQNLLRLRCDADAGAPDAFFEWAGSTFESQPLTDVVHSHQPQAHGVRRGGQQWRDRVADEGAGVVFHGLNLLMAIWDLARAIFTLPDPDIRLGQFGGKGRR